MEPQPKEQSTVPTTIRDVAHPNPSWFAKRSIRQYGMAALFAAALFILLSLYAYARVDNYAVANAAYALADTALIMLGAMLLLGPLARIFNLFDGLLAFRKEIGVVAWLVALGHITLMLYGISSVAGLLQFILSAPLLFTFGFVAALILTGLFLISRGRIFKTLGVKRWWWLQYWGARLGFGLIVLHMLAGKYSAWTAWYQGDGTYGTRSQLPEAGLLVAWFSLFVVVVRMGEWKSPRVGRIAWYGGLAVLMGVYIVTFMQGTL